MPIAPGRSVSYILSKRVADYMDTDVLTMSQKTPTRDATRLMQAKDKDVIVVIGPDTKPVGIVTESDILDKVSDVNVNAEYTTLADIMNPVITVDRRSTIQNALYLMRDSRVKKLPVLAKNGRSVGVIYRSRIAKAIQDSTTTDPRLLSPPVKAVLGNLGFVLQFAGVLMLVPAVLATILGDTVTATGVYLTTVLLLVTGFLLNSYGEKSSLNMQQSSILVFASLFILILFGTIPYIYLAPYETTSYVEQFANGFFSSAAGFTTGGVSLFDRPEDLPQAFTFYRGYSQLVGGMSFIYLVMTAFYPEDKLVAMRGFLTGRKLRMRELFGTITLIFMLYIAVIATLLYLFGERNFIDNVSLAMSTVATGGFLPTSTILGDLIWYEHVILMGGMILGALPFVLHYGLVKQRFSMPNLEKEVIAYFAILAGGAMIFLSVSGLGPLEGVFYSISASSTAGLQSGTFGPLNDESRIVLAVLMFAGGCGFSTAGGIKIFRLVTLCEEAALPLARRLRKGICLRSAARGVAGDLLGASFWKGVSGRVARERETVFAGVVVCLFPVIAFAVAGHLADITGAPYDVAFFEAAGLITTGGLSAGVIDMDTDPATKIAMSFVMIFGRLEIIAILYIFIPWAGGGTGKKGRV